MGNSSSRRTAQRSETLEEYCQIFNFTLVKPLGSTIFFKTAKIKFEGEFYVAKFISFNPEISEAIRKAQENNNFIERALLSSLNCLPYKAIIKERMAVLMRPFMYISLLDRMYSNPALLWIEKKWIIFQLLCALNLCRRNRIYHGDLKPENIMFTSWNFVFITDFASYKPVYLSETNSTDYIFLFDISNRRICYTAPERFYKSDDVNIFERFINYEDKGEHSMDIFSLGCVIAELCLDGKPLCDFSSRNMSGKYDQSKMESQIREIADENIREMVLSMISENPNDRQIAEYYISRYFPESYYSYLMKIMQEIMSANNLTADYIITAMNFKWNEINDNFDFMSKSNQKTEKVDTMGGNPGFPEKSEFNVDIAVKGESESVETKIGGSHVETPCEDIKGAEQPGNKGGDWEGNIHVILLSLYTSFLSHLNSNEAKYAAFNLFKLFEPHIHFSVFFERAIPHMLIFFEDSDPNVVSEAIYIVTDYLSTLPANCSLSHEIFIDFILPTYYDLCLGSKQSLVLLSLAAKIGDLSQLIYRQLNAVSRIKGQREVNLYETEFDLLCDYFGEIVIKLLFTGFTPEEAELAQRRIIGTNDIIIQLLRCSMVQIFRFFGEDRFRSTIMPHIINVAHKKDSWEVRSEFFLIFADIFTFNQLYDTSSMFLSLFDYGLKDCEEFVIHSTIMCFNSIFENDHLDTGILLTLIKRISSFLLHPNTTIRSSVVCLISKIARQFGPAFTQYCIVPYFSDVLKDDVHSADIGILLKNIYLPMSRELVNGLINLEKSPETIFSTIKMRFRYGKLVEGGKFDFVTDFPSKVRRACMKMSLPDISRILKLENVVCGIHGYKDNFTNSSANITSSFVQIDEKYIQFPTFNYPEDSEKVTSTYPVDLFSLKDLNYSPKSPKTKRNPEKHFPYNYTVYLHQFFNSKREEAKLKTLKQFSQRPSIILTGGDLQGAHVATVLHQDAPIFRISTDYESIHVVSSSYNSKCYMWRISDILKGTYEPLQEVILSTSSKEPWFVSHLPFDQNFAVLSKSGSLDIYDVENNKRINIASNISKDSGKMTGLHLCGVNSGSAYAITLSNHGCLTMVDLRVPKPIFMDTISVDYGRCNCLDVDYSNTWLAVGTNSGSCVCWDIRFRSPFTILKSPDHVRRIVRSVMISNVEENELAVSYDSQNSIMLWNVAHSRVLTYLNTTGDIDPVRRNWKAHFVSRMIGYECGQQSKLLSVGSDTRIRDWNLSNVYQSRVFAMGGSESDCFGLSYSERRFPEYSEVFEKNIYLGENEDLDRKSLIKGFPGHLSLITDVKLVTDGSGEKLCISSSFDKTIKIWR